MSEQLYRMYDADGVLLYVGISKSAIRRMTEHADTQPWWSDVATQTIEHIECDRRQALDIERDTIKRERPKYNVVHADVYSADYVALYGVPIVGLPRPKMWVAIPDSRLLQDKWSLMSVGRVACVTRTGTIIVHLEFSKEKRLIVDADGVAQWRKFKTFTTLRDAWFDKQRVWPAAA